MGAIVKKWIYTFIVLMLLSPVAGATASGGGGGTTNNIFEALKMIPGTLSLTNDGISPSHQLLFCSPIPADSYPNPPGMKNCNIFTLDFKDFPANNLPSGGTSTRISPSEMSIVYIKINNYAGSGIIKQTWYNRDTGKQLYQSISNVGQQDNKGDTWWYWWSWSLIGHFDWEIARPGNYYVTIDTTWGNSRFDFTVVDTTLPPTPTPTPTQAPLIITAPYTFYFNPSPVTLTVNTIGTITAYSGHSFELYPGTYTYKVEKTGYITQQGSFTRAVTSGAESKTITLQSIATPTPTPSPSPTPTPQPAPRAPGAATPPILSSLWGALMEWFKSLGV